MERLVVVVGAISVLTSWLLWRRKKATLLHRWSKVNRILNYGNCHCNITCGAHTNMTWSAVCGAVFWQKGKTGRGDTHLRLTLPGSWAAGSLCHELIGADGSPIGKPGSPQPSSARERERGERLACATRGFLALFLARWSNDVRARPHPFENVTEMWPRPVDD